MFRISRTDTSLFDHICSFVTISGGAFLAVMAIVSWYFMT